MNYMKQVTEMLGVETREKFDLKNAHNYTIKDCYLDNDGLHNNRSIIIECDFADILNGNAEIIKKPFKPKYSETYWIINENGRTARISNDNQTFDCMAIHMGNCFRTEAEAEEHKDEIMAKFREVMGDA